MSSYPLPVLSGLILLPALAWLAGVAWERRRARARSGGQGWRDPVSGVYSRTLLLELFSRQLSLAARLQHPVSVLMVEFDGPHTPAMCQALAQRLAARVREYDLLGRWEEGRFLLVLPDADVGSALVLAQDLCDGQTRHPPPPGAEPDRASVSVGVYSRRPVLRESPAELALAMAAAAQRALDATRADGPGRVEVEP
ncbi:MAG: hypothetical protein RLZZ555_397 [Pseudomonadota bacterium]|jgi:GGDEF domain-containing protein